MRGTRIAVTLAIMLPVTFGMQRMVSLAMSPPAPPVVRTPVQAIMPLPADLDDLMAKGRELSDSQAKAMVKRVGRDPGDAPTRAVLLAYSSNVYDGSDKKLLHDEQAAWFVANLPDSPLLSDGPLNVDNVSNVRTYELLKDLYEEALARRPKNVAILSNYAALILIPEKTEAIALLKRAAELDPKNPDRYARLAFAHSLASHRLFGANDPKEASLAAEGYRKARALGGRVSAKEVLETLFDTGRLDDATREAKAALATSGDADTVHAAHTTLGRIALLKGDLARAKAHLLASAKVEGSPVLGSFGPEMVLAQGLLAKGERATVLTYLKATGEFWHDERQVRWTKTVESGATPDWN